jgi:hypothetical protein
MAATYFEQDAEFLLQELAQQMSAWFDRTSPTAGTVNWTLPTSTSHIYDGVLILAKTGEINPSNFPTDGQTYTASLDLLSPASQINDAIVVGALYGNKTTTFLNITGLNPNANYFFSVHPLTNTKYYYKAGVLTYPLSLNTSAFTGDVPSSTTPPIDPVLGDVYYNQVTGKVYMWTGSNWIEASMYDTLTGRSFPTGVVNQGQFFYNVNTRILYVFDGTSWKEANTQNRGQVQTDKIGIGTDGSQDERKRVMMTLKTQMGWPQQCIELTDINFNVAINNALATARQRIDLCYTHEYFYVRMKKGQSVYYLNDPVSGTNRIADVIRVYRLGPISGMPVAGQADAFYSQAFLNMYYASGEMDQVTFYLVTAFSKQLMRLFAGDIQFSWRESTRELTIFRNFGMDEHAIVEVAAEKTEQELLQDRYLNQWLLDWAEAEAMDTLGQIRSKFGSLPGPNGGISLNGDALMARSAEMKTELLRQISDREVGGWNFGNDQFFIG